MPNTVPHDHDKCYCQTILLSYPPQYPWICRICGEQGVDHADVIIHNEYEELKRKWNQK